MSSSVAFSSVPSLTIIHFQKLCTCPPKLCPHEALTPQPPCLPEPDHPCSTLCLSGSDCSAMSGIRQHVSFSDDLTFTWHPVLEAHFILEHVLDFLPLEVGTFAWHPVVEAHFILEHVLDFLPLEVEITFHCLSNALQLWCWRRRLRVPWTARRSTQSINKGNQS